MLNARDDKMLPAAAEYQSIAKRRRALEAAARYTALRQRERC